MAREASDQGSWFCTQTATRPSLDPCVKAPRWCTVDLRDGNQATSASLLSCAPASQKSCQTSCASGIGQPDEPREEAVNPNSCGQRNFCLLSSKLGIHAVRLRLFLHLLKLGYKEIEVRQITLDFLRHQPAQVGFPAASQTDFDFIRCLARKDLQCGSYSEYTEQRPTRVAEPCGYGC